MRRGWGWLTDAVRDYLYEHRGERLDVATVTDAVNELRQAGGVPPYTASGAVRRSLNELASADLATVIPGMRPAHYQWANSLSLPPSGYRSTLTRKADAAKMAGVKTPAPLQVGGSQEAKLRAAVNQRKRDLIHGVPAEEEEKPAELPKPQTMIERPNGEVYRVRTIDGKADIDVMRTLRDKKLFPLLSGPPGTGKTAYVEASFGPDIVLFPGDVDTSVDDLFGTYSPDGEGGWDWVDGPATYAMKEGKVLFLDDVTVISPKVLAGLYPLMDGREETVIKTHMVSVDAQGKPWQDGRKHPESVRAARGFFVVGAYNPGTAGAILSDALASRFKFHMEIQSDWDLARSAGVPEPLVKLAKTLASAHRGGEVGWCPQLREIFAATAIAGEFGLGMAFANLARLAQDEEDRKFVLSKIRSVHGESGDVRALSMGGEL